METSPEVLFGNLTLFFAMAMTFVGFPSQIWKQYREKKSGVSMPLALLATAVYASRFCYGTTIKSWYIATPDFFGLLFSMVVIYQIHHYKEPRN